MPGYMHRIVANITEQVEAFELAQGEGDGLETDVTDGSETDASWELCERAAVPLW